MTVTEVGDDDEFASIVVTGRVEAALGGGDDLATSDGPAFVAGGPGDDWLISSGAFGVSFDGGDGDDDLEGGRGVDRLLGGPGADVFSGYNAARDLNGDELICGPGADIIESAGALTSLDCPAGIGFPNFGRLTDGTTLGIELRSDQALAAQLRVVTPTPDGRRPQLTRTVTRLLQPGANSIALRLNARGRRFIRRDRHPQMTLRVHARSPPSNRAMGGGTTFRTSAALASTARGPSSSRTGWKLAVSRSAPYTPHCDSAVAQLRPSRRAAPNRPTEQRASEPNGAPGLLLWEEAEVSACAGSSTPSGCGAARSARASPASPRLARGRRPARARARPCA